MPYRLPAFASQMGGFALQWFYCLCTVYLCRRVIEVLDSPEVVKSEKFDSHAKSKYICTAWHQWSLFLIWGLCLIYIQW